ncbi:MAG: Pycsar system effector family protein [Chitinophagaceae bacterium]
MNEANEQLLSITRTYVTEIYQHRIKPEFVFHNLEHTEDVAEACSHMADYYQLPDDDRLVLMLSAWFHDAGYSLGAAEGHEEASAQMATQFLQSRHVDEGIVQRVASCIQSTKMPQSPVSLIEKILCDADLQHLANEDYKARNQLLKRERENLLGHKIDKKEWKKGNIRFLMEHQYFTEYGQELLTAKKMTNLAILENRKDEKQPVELKLPNAYPYVSVNTSKTEAKDLKNSERGVQTMFRTTSNNHIELSGMADNKAHIMITVNSIMLSVLLSYGIPRLMHYPQFHIPAAMLVLTSLIAIILSIIATRPSINKGKFTEEDIRNKKTNLLFFGNFHRMQLNDYQWGVNQMIRDKEYLYNTMMMDIYYLGVVLAKKYRYLRIAYTVFGAGLILSIIAFGIAYLVMEPGAVTTDRIDYPAK